MRLSVTTRSLLCRFFGWSDVTRWSSAAELSPDWDERTRLLARLIPHHAHVIEFGAGRRQIEQYLPAGCTYIPSDLVDRGGGTFICDLNRRPLPDLSPLGVDTAVFGGVFEYIQNVPSLVAWLARQVRCCIVSYECTRTHHTEWRRLHECGARARAGWVNAFHEDEFVELFQKQGFSVVCRELWHTKDGDERVFVFSLGSVVARKD
jgi:hypothetical protein